MEHDEFRRHLGKAAVSVGEFASLLGVRANSISNYAKKGVVPRTHALVAVLLGDAADRKVDFRAVLKRYGIRPKASDRVTKLDDYRATEKKKNRLDQK